MGGGVAVHLVHKVLPVRASQAPGDLLSQSQRLTGGPARQNTRMHHEDALVVMGQRLMTNKFDQFFGIGGLQNIVQGVGERGSPGATRDGQQMEVVVAQDANRLWTGCPNQAQGLGGLRTSIHKVPNEPELVSVLSKGELTDQGR